MNYSEDLNEFNNFDKNYNKIINTFDDYILEARQYLYFRNQEIIWTENELELLFYTDADFQWSPSTIGDLNIGVGCIFNMLFNTMNKYFNPIIIFTKESMNELLLNPTATNEFYINSVNDGVTYNYNFNITLL